MKNQIYERIIKHYGNNPQLDKLEEELTELLLAVKHYRKGKLSIAELTSELVDCDIMIEQARMIFAIDDETYYRAKRYKKERTLKRIASNGIEVSEDIA